VILVDSTVWIDLLRNCETVPVSRLRKLLDAGEAAVAPVIVQELLQGATDAAGFAKLYRYFTAIQMSGAENSLARPRIPIASRQRTRTSTGKFRGLCSARRSTHGNAEPWAILIDSHRTTEQDEPRTVVIVVHEKYGGSMRGSN
jgi:hypothetical protein